MLCSRWISAEISADFIIVTIVLIALEWYITCPVLGLSWPCLEAICAIYARIYAEFQIGPLVAVRRCRRHVLRVQLRSGWKLEGGCSGGNRPHSQSFRLNSPVVVEQFRILCDFGWCQPPYNLAWPGPNPNLQPRNLQNPLVQVVIGYYNWFTNDPLQLRSNTH